MSDASTKHLIASYLEEASAPMFLSGFFLSPPENFHNSEKVEIDIERDDEEIAIVVTDLAAGGRHNESNLYTNKGFTPPIFKEEGSLSAYEMIKRQPGRHPFNRDLDFAEHALRQSFSMFRKLERKIRRSVELMASQVLQTGVLTLADQNGTALYELDFQPKATHITQVSVTWAEDGSTGVPLADLEDLARVVRRDGKRQPKKLVFGDSAFQRFLANEDVKARLDNRGMNVGQVAPVARGEGATFQGWVWIGHYRFEMWTYDGFYKDPQTGEHVAYVDPDNVIMLSEGGRLDLSYGAIPMIVQPEQRALPFLPPRISGVQQGIDLTTNAWLSPNGESLIVSAGTRPLTIPTAIDTFACLDVTT